MLKALLRDTWPRSGPSKQGSGEEWITFLRLSKYLESFRVDLWDHFDNRHIIPPIRNFRWLPFSERISGSPPYSSFPLPVLYFLRETEFRGVDDLSWLYFSQTRLLSLHYSTPFYEISAPPCNWTCLFFTPHLNRHWGSYTERRVGSSCICIIPLMTPAGRLKLTKDLYNFAHQFYSVFPHKGCLLVIESLSIVYGF